MTPVSIPPDPYQRALKDLRLAREELREANERIKRMDYALHTAWYLIANVDLDTGKHSHMRDDFLNWMEKDLSPLMINRVKEANP